MSNAPMRPAVVGPLEPSVGRLGPEPPPADLRCCKLTPNKCKWCGHDIHAHDKQYGCAEDGCDCETPNANSASSDVIDHVD